MNSRELIEMYLCNITEGTLFEASHVYDLLADDMTEVAFYKILNASVKKDYWFT